MILLTKAHLLFMADYAWLSFQDAGITCGFFSQPGGIRARAFGAKFRQIRQAHHTNR